MDCHCTADSAYYFVIIYYIIYIRAVLVLLLGNPAGAGFCQICKVDPAKVTVQQIVHAGSRPFCMLSFVLCLVFDICWSGIKYLN